MTALLDDSGFRIETSVATINSETNSSVHFLKRKSNDIPLSKGSIYDPTVSVNCSKRPREMMEVQGVLDLTINSKERVNGSKPSPYDSDPAAHSFNSKSLSSTPSPQSSSSSQPNLAAYLTGFEQSQQTLWCGAPIPAHTTKTDSPLAQGNFYPSPCLAPAAFNALMQQHMGMNAAAAAAAAAAASFNLLGTTPWTAGVPLFPGVASPMMNMLPVSTTYPMSNAQSSYPPPTPQLGSESAIPLNLNINSNHSDFQFRWSPVAMKTESSPTTAEGFFTQFSEAMALCNPMNGLNSTNCVPASSAKVREHESSTHVKSDAHSYDSFAFGLQTSQKGNEGMNQTKLDSPTGTSFGQDSSMMDVNCSSRFDDMTDELVFPSKSPVNPIRKYTSCEECGSPACQSSALREHYHCKSCNKLIIRREEMIRHAKWHRKREESLQYGFMRYSPGDNCAVPDCVHNGRQTHYHCVKPNCTKVYISTSDVQMHANFHRKDAVIIQEGFQRFRASENCGIQDCPFAKERTTHFHCRRSNCHFTFKNKADMEKHKLHHQKNDNFAKDGFRKYIKCESCGFSNCKYSGIINHIHCIRPGCDYVVHSSSQILSHKRKHDRRYSHLHSTSSDSYLSRVSNESPYTLQNPATPTGNRERLGGSQNSQDEYSFNEIDPTGPNSSPDKEKGAMEVDESLDQSALTGSTSPRGLSFLHSNKAFCFDLESSEPKLESSKESTLFYIVSRLVTKCVQHRKRQAAASTKSESSVVNGNNYSAKPKPNYSIDYLFPSSGEEARTEHMDDNGDAASEDNKQVLQICGLVGKHFKKCLPESGEGEACDIDPTKRHNHCYWPGCRADRSGVEQSYCPQWVSHIWQATLLRRGLTRCDGSECPHSTESTHFHCFFWPDCDFTNPQGESDFEILYAHLVQHDSRLSSQSAEAFESTSSPVPISESNSMRIGGTGNTDEVFGQLPRRRGRPPKYTKYVRVPRMNVPEELCKDDPQIQELTHSMFLTPVEAGIDDTKNESSPSSRVVCGVKLFLRNESCQDELCDYSNRGMEHYHCVRPRCFMTSDSLDMINVHRREFHNHINIAPGFEYFDRSVDCRRPTCHSRRTAQHYHCTYPNCDYSFIRPSTMMQHARKHEELAKARRYPGYFVSGFNRKEKFIVKHPRISKPSSNLDAKPPYLPLGMSSIVAAQIPSFLPTSQQGVNASCEKVQEPTFLSPNSIGMNADQLPGFLPIWAAAMAAAAAASKPTTVPSILPNPIQDPSRSFAGLQDNPRTILDTRMPELEKTSVGV